MKKPPGYVPALTNDLATKGYADQFAGSTNPTLGNYLIPWNVLTIGTGTPVSGTVYFHQIKVNPSLTMQSITVSQVAAQSGGSGTVSLGIYADNGTDGSPKLSSLLYSGNIPDNINGGGGWRSVATTATLPPGVYWTAFLLVTSGTVTTASTWSCNANSISLWSSTPQAITRAFSIAGQTSLPTSGTLVPVVTTVAPVVTVRRSATV